jgi:DNA-binding response OmpR family regulator
MARILIIEDDLVLRSDLALTVAEAGHEVRDASSAMQALKLMDSFAPDLVICDVCMPHVSGVELKLHIDRQKAKNNTIFFFVSALSQVKLAQAATEAEVDDYFCKPVGSFALMTAVDEHLKRKSKGDRTKSLWGRRNATARPV